MEYREAPSRDFASAVKIDELAVTTTRLTTRLPRDRRRTQRRGLEDLGGAQLLGLFLMSSRSLARPKARLFVSRSPWEMKWTGTPKKVLGTLFFQASANSTPVIAVKMSMPAGATPI